MVEKDGSDPEAARVLEAGGVENPSMPATVHISGQPFTIRHDAGVWRGEGVLDHERHRLTGKDKQELIDKFVSLARRTKKQALQELTDAPAIRIQRILGSQLRRMEVVQAVFPAETSARLTMGERLQAILGSNLSHGRHSARSERLICEP